MLHDAFHIFFAFEIIVIVIIIINDYHHSYYHNVWSCYYVIIIRRYVIEIWHVVVRVRHVVNQPRTARKESESQKVKTFEGDLGAVQKARASGMVSNGQSWWMGLGPWPRDWDCWSSRSLEKPFHPSSCCFWISGNVLFRPPHPKHISIWRILSVRFFKSQQVPMMPRPAVSSYTLKNQHGPFEMVKETPSFHTSESISFGVWLFTWLATQHPCIPAYGTYVPKYMYNYCMHAFILCMKSTRAEFLMYLQEYICFWCRPLVNC